MSIADKNLLSKEIEDAIGEILTAKNTALVMRIIAERLDGYSVEVADACSDGFDSKDLLKAFLDAKATEGRSEKTVERYRYIINRMLTEVRVPIRKLNVYHMRAYIMSLRERGLSDSTVEGIREVMTSFFGWLFKENLIERNPCANLGAIRCEKVVRTSFSDVEIEKIKEACTKNRDRAIIAFLLSTGCRISEMCGLDRKDIDLDKGECVVYGKGKKERTVYLNPISVMNLRRYFLERADMSPALFTGKGTERLKPGGVRLMLKRIEAKSGVENIHPHRFRRTLATNLINRGMAIQDVAVVLGHDKLDTTMRYIYIDQKALKTSYQRYA